MIKYDDVEWRLDLSGQGRQRTEKFVLIVLDSYFKAKATTKCVKTRVWQE